MRHGQAVAGSPHDAGRALDPVGENHAERAATGLANCDLQRVSIWSSPYLRARQTAEVVARVLDCRVEIRDELEPDSSPQTAADLISQFDGDAGALVLVSHMPLVARLIGWLTSAAGQPSAGIALGTAAVARLSGEPPLPGCFRLQWVRGPEAW